LKLLSAKMIDLREEERKMKSWGSKISIIAVFFSTLLIMSSAAQASRLFALDGNPADRQIGLVQQALQWLGGTWTDLKVAFSQDEAAPPPTPTCTNPSGCSEPEGDSGWTIDPDG
jgi:hypothetical protein